MEGSGEKMVKVRTEIWKELMLLKVNLGKKSLSDVIEYLIERADRPAEILEEGSA